MDPIFLFDLASQKASWLTARQAVLSRNVANANSPGFRAQDIEPFSATLDKTALAMVTTSESHLAVQPGQVRSARPTQSNGREGWGVYHSGNSVNLDEELLKAGEVSREFGVATAITKSFHKFVLTSVRSQG